MTIEQIQADTDKAEQVLSDPSELASQSRASDPLQANKSQGLNK